ncbi:ribonuclease P [Methanobrevibacter sp. TMH8]|uniref:Rpp14/Pop5 family protein n=1 Tax=Methanobrevibacter sp. TMH8 TaxID=2848611 RepID=UPI001CCC8F69|nr:Rpp14/Pop5 family protein [Methanobrevibacter sp. TMH8]MBZ9571351.1 ribonuclease P [Methanobrevibacter sp. TMH8]
MKLKILPPTLRINNHYLSLDIKSESEINKDELVSAIWFGCLRLYGEIETSAFNLWLMRFYSNNSYKNDNNICNNKENNHDIYDNNKNTQFNNDLSYYHYKAVLRCQRGYEDKVRGSLALLTKYNHKKIAISTIGISGTIASSIEKFIK